MERWLKRWVFLFVISPHVNLTSKGRRWLERWDPATVFASRTPTEEEEKPSSQLQHDICFPPHLSKMLAGARTLIGRAADVCYQCRRLEPSSPPMVLGEGFFSTLLLQSTINTHTETHSLTHPDSTLEVLTFWDHWRWLQMCFHTKA